MYFNKIFGVINLHILYFFYQGYIYIFAFSRGAVVVFEMLMIAPVAISYFLKKFSISTIDSSVITNRLVSSAYWESFRFSFWLSMEYPTIFLFVLMFRFITSLFLIYNRRNKGHPCLTPLDNGKGVDRNLLFAMTDCVFLYIFLR